jgi:hypothetical protein
MNSLNSTPSDPKSLHVTPFNFDHSLKVRSSFKIT